MFSKKDFIYDTDGILLVSDVRAKMSGSQTKIFVRISGSFAGGPVKIFFFYRLPNYHQKTDMTVQVIIIYKNKIG